MTPVTPIRTRGGAGASGRAVYAVAPPCELLAPFCEFATTDTLHEWCFFRNPSKSYGWRRWNTEPGAEYLFELRITQDGGQLWVLYGGGDCGGLVVIDGGDTHNPYQTVSFTAPSVGAWFRVDGHVSGFDAQGLTRLTRTS